MYNDGLNLKPQAADVSSPESIAKAVATITAECVRHPHERAVVFPGGHPMIFLTTFTLTTRAGGEGDTGCVWGAKRIRTDRHL